MSPADRGASSRFFADSWEIVGGRLSQETNGRPHYSTVAGAHLFYSIDGKWLLNFGDGPERVSCAAYLVRDQRDEMEADRQVGSSLWVRLALLFGGGPERVSCVAYLVQQAPRGEAGIFLV